MAHAMAKLAVLFCIALLVAHVDSARTLKEEVTGDIIFAETHATEESTFPVPADDSAVPAPDSVAYNYATEEATAEEPATEEAATEDSETEEPATEDSVGEFASGGFLLPSPPLYETEELPSEGEYTQDSTTLASEENTAQEGTLWQSQPEESSDDATAASFAEETTTDDDSSTPPYDFDATTQDADSIYPAEAVADSFATQFDNQDSGSEETTEPGFAFDDSVPVGYGN